MRRLRPAYAAVTALVIGAGAAAPAEAGDRTDVQTTQLVSQTPSGGVPNGPSGNSVISGDKRYARVVAYESDASDIVAGDTNGQKDVFAVIRTATFGNLGSPWTPGRTVLVSRTSSGAPANGPSFAPSIDGAFQDAEFKEPSCIGFLSAASNMVPGDTNGVVDAFVRGVGTGTPKLVSPAGAGATTAVAVSSDCSRIAVVAGDHLYVYDGRVTQMIATDGAAKDPSFGVGRNQDLVFGTPSGAWLLEEGKTTAKLVAPGGANPAYNDVKRQVVAYEKPAGGVTQVYFRDLGGPEQPASERQGVFGDGPSTKPVIGNSGYSISFESGATNLGVNALGRIGDTNGQPDVYLYTGVRDITLVQSVQEKAVPLPGGGTNPGMNFYNNYMTFDSPAPLGAASGPAQVFMRYLGGESASSAGLDELPAPEVGKTANVQVLSGVVYIKVPRGTKTAKYGLTAAAASGFVKLEGAKTVPVGSSMDTTAGRMLLQTAIGTAAPNQVQNAQFYSGVFQITQVGGKKRPITQLAMNGALDCRSGKLSAAAKKKRSRQLWGNGKGRYRTRGRNSSATVRGTYWLTKDSCTKTTTVVREGTVVVKDFRKHKNVTVKAGHRYTARAR